MAHQNDNILDNSKLTGLGSSAGYKLPEGYFESFVARMERSLPERPEAEVAEQPADERTPWQRVRAYVYMAAMFAGIWLMLQMVTMLSGKATLEPMESNPMIATALTTEDFVNDYVYRDISSYELVDDMLVEGEISQDSEFIGIFTEDSDFDSTYILP